MFSVLSCRNTNLVNLFSRQTKPFLRSIAFFEKIRPQSSVLSKTGYKIIYEFHSIRILGPFLKIQRWLPALGVALSPIFYFLDETKMSSVCALTSAGCFFLLGIPISKLARNIVGKMYINKEGNVKDVIISSIDGSGRRIDRIHKIDDLINNEFTSVPTRFMGFINLAIKDSDTYYLLNINNCKFIDENACNCILGSNWDFYNVRENENELKDNKKKELKG